MRHALKLECIGDDTNQLLRSLGEKPLRQPWVARLHPRWAGFDRDFMRGHKDYAEANSKGSRGVYLHYQLDPGVYEVNQLVSWGSTHRHFLIVDDAGEATEATREEAMQWLKA